MRRTCGRCKETTPNSQLPTSNSQGPRWRLGVGVWKLMEVGSWELGVDFMKIRDLQLPSPFAIAPMAGMTDTAFRRLVKRQGGCGLVVSEMVSSEGLVRGIDRTHEYAEYTEEERPVSIQIFGGDPEKMADAAQIV